MFKAGKCGINEVGSRGNAALISAQDFGVDSVTEYIVGDCPVLVNDRVAKSSEGGVVGVDDVDRLIAGRDALAARLIEGIGALRTSAERNFDVLGDLLGEVPSE